MKRNLIAILAFMSMFANAQAPLAPIRQVIDVAWQFRKAHDAQWMDTRVPASVHNSLLKNGVIEDPFYRDNEEKLQWIEQEDWEFHSEFDVDLAVFDRKHIDMTFRGLDTYAQVYLNDSLILDADNMFRSWRVDVKKYLKAKGNTLHVYFESPVKKTAKDWANLGYELPGGPRTLTRKAQFHYGWDWGPRFVGAGIYNKPELTGWDDFIIDNVWILPVEVDEKRAKMVARYTYRSDKRLSVSIHTRIDNTKAIEDRIIEIGNNRDSVTFDIYNPKLWWCNGMGAPNLYDITLEVRHGVKLIDEKKTRTGVRKIELVREKDAKGETFYFKLNGKPVFCKGANYIPQDIFQDRVTPEKYRALIDDVVGANMNMLRVWGGGIYEDNLFYELCDSHGILVWQDFMYACAMYPGNGRFFKTAAAEALEQVERLRNHPSIALWCGNNENNEAWHNWGWQMQFNEDQRTSLWRDYQNMFNVLLPNYVEADAEGVPYWESSPKYGRGNPKHQFEGDAHYWGVWHDEEPFEMFAKKVPRFMSEYGFQSFPEWRTIESFTTPEDRKLDSKVMLLHQKHPRGNALIAEYMKRDYHTPADFESFVYVSQLLQAEGMRKGIEAHRRAKPYCMGTLYWQLNDVWPVASWSSIDSYGRWKALHYYAKEAFSPMAALPVVEDDILKIYGVADIPHDTTATLEVRILQFDGDVQHSETIPNVRLSNDSSRMIWQGSLKSILRKTKKQSAVAEIVLKTGNDIAYRRLFYFVPPKDLNLPTTKITMAVSEANNGYKLTLTSEKLAKNVLLSTQADGMFSDNYFDLMPGEKKEIFFKTERILDNWKEAFKARSLN